MSKPKKETRVMIGKLAMPLGDKLGPKRFFAEHFRANPGGAEGYLCDLILENRKKINELIDAVNQLTFVRKTTKKSKKAK